MSSFKKIKSVIALVSGIDDSIKNLYVHRNFPFGKKVLHIKKKGSFKICSLQDF